MALVKNIYKKYVSYRSRPAEDHKKKLDDIRDEVSTLYNSEKMIATSIGTHAASLSKLKVNKAKLEHYCNVYSAHLQKLREAHNQPPKQQETLISLDFTQSESQLSLTDSPSSRSPSSPPTQQLSGESIEELMKTLEDVRPKLATLEESIRTLEAKMQALLEKKSTVKSKRVVIEKELAAQDPNYVSLRDIEIQDVSGEVSGETPDKQRLLTRQARLEETMKYNKLFEGVNVSVLSVGGGPFGGVYGPIGEKEVSDTINRALELGINFFDTSPLYGVTKSETNMGKAFKNIPREKFFLCSKTGRFDEDKFDFSADRVTKSVDESLARLNVDYLDLILCHDVEFVHLDQVINEAIPALVKLKAAGKVKAIGFSCYPLKPYVEIIKRVPPKTIDAVLVYAHNTLFDTTLNSLMPFFQENNVAVINASPLGLGLLTDGGSQPWNPSDSFVKETCAKAAAHCRAKGQNISKLAVQFSVRTNPNIVSTIVGVNNVQQLEENVRWLEEDVDEELLKEVMEILEPIKDHKRISGLPENN